MAVATAGVLAMRCLVVDVDVDVDVDVVVVVVVVVVLAFVGAAVALVSTSPHTQRLGPWNEPSLCCTVSHFGSASRSVVTLPTPHPYRPSTPALNDQLPLLHPNPKYPMSFVTLVLNVVAVLGVVFSLRTLVTKSSYVSSDLV